DRRDLAEAMNVLERDDDPLVVRDVDADQTRHCWLPLPLLVLRIRTDHPEHALPADHLAVLADPPDRSPDLHGLNLYPRRFAPRTVISRGGSRRALLFPAAVRAAHCFRLERLRSSNFARAFFSGDFPREEPSTLPIGDAALVKIVGRHLDRDLVSGEDADE